MAVSACLLALAVVGVAPGPVLTKGVACLRPVLSSHPQSTSGITYAGDGLFYVVADDRGDLADHEGGLYAYRMTLSADGLSLKSFASPTTNEVVKLSGGYDQEGCAYDPLTGAVWVSDEVRKSIRAFDPKTGEVRETLAYPPILGRARGNFGVEGLTLSPDGLTMWFANEEALACDGSRSAWRRPTTVRLFRFVREGAGRPFRPKGQFPYVTDGWKCRFDCRSGGRHGVAGLCALPDGSLLVLERDLSFSSRKAMDIVLSPAASHLGWSIYRVAKPADGTDVTENASLASDASWKPVRKELLASEGGGVSFYGNFEGLCLGPRLADGSHSLLLISDAGDGCSKPMILPLVLTGAK